MKTPRHAPPVVRDGKTLLPAHAVSTAPVTAFGLIGGYLTARETGTRPATSTAPRPWSSAS